MAMNFRSRFFDLFNEMERSFPDDFSGFDSSQGQSSLDTSRKGEKGQQQNQLVAQSGGQLISPQDSSAVSRLWNAQMDVVESKDKWLLTMDLPGLNQNDIKVELNDDMLTLSGERRAEQREESDRYHRFERAHGSFQRSWRVPRNVKQDAISASYDNGVLRVTLPKSAEQESQQRRAIQVGSGIGSQSDFGTSS